MLPSLQSCSSDSKDMKQYDGFPPGEMLRPFLSLKASILFAASFLVRKASSSVSVKALKSRGAGLPRGIAYLRQSKEIIPYNFTLDQCVQGMKQADTNHDGLLDSNEYVDFINLRRSNYFGNATNFLDLPIDIITLFNYSACECSKSTGCCVSGATSSMSASINITAPKKAVKFCSALIQAKSTTRVTPQNDGFNTLTALSLSFIAFAAGNLTAVGLYRTIWQKNGHDNSYLPKLQNSSNAEPTKCNECVETGSLDDLVNSNELVREANSSGWSSTYSATRPKSSSFDLSILVCGSPTIGNPIGFDSSVTLPSEEGKIEDIFTAKIQDTTDPEDGKVNDNNEFREMERLRRDLSYECERCDAVTLIVDSSNSGQSHFSQGVASNSAEEADISSKLSARTVVTTKACLIPRNIFIVRPMTSKPVEQSDSEEMSSLSLGSDATDYEESSPMDSHDGSSDENSSLGHIDILSSRV